MHGKQQRLWSYEVKPTLKSELMSFFLVICDFNLRQFQIFLQMYEFMISEIIQVFYS